jgi:hypothetical protein
VLGFLAQEPLALTSYNGVARTASCRERPSRLSGYSEEDDLARRGLPKQLFWPQVSALGCRPVACLSVIIWRFALLNFDTMTALIPANIGSKLNKATRRRRFGPGKDVT